MQHILKSKLFIAMASLLTVIAATAVISINVSHSVDDLQVKLDLGNKYVSELDYENAIIAYEEALEIDPYCLDAYLGLSDAYLALGQEDMAIEIMEQAKELLPENVDIYVSLAQLYASQGQTSLAVSILEEGIETTGSDRLKDMLGEYWPEDAKTELAAGRGTSAETSEIPPKEEDSLEDDTVSIGIRQETKPIIVVSREDEEVVEIPLVVPLPDYNAGNETESGGRDHTSGIGEGSYIPGSDDGDEGNLPGDDGGNEEELPGDGEDSSLPDDGGDGEGENPGGGEDSNLSDDGGNGEGENPGDGEDSNLPDDGGNGEGENPGGGEDSNLPGDGDDEGNLPGGGDDGNLPGGGDGGDDPDIVVPVLPSTGIAGSVYGINGQGLEGVTVTVYSGQDEVLVSAGTDITGNYLQELLEGDYRIVLSKDGYADLSTSVSVLADALTSNAYIMLTEEESRQSASLKGVVISALDSAAVEGATVALLNGFDHPSYQDPDAIAGSSHTTTGASGEFSIENGVTAGYYTVVASKDNYSTYHHNETIKPGENELQISMSPLIRNQGVYRIVLEWGSSPRDLDSHITSNGNDNYHVYYANRNSEDGKAVLDRDVTSSYGPETITLEIGEGNSYIYSVYNYTNGSASQGSPEAWNLANSGAKVTVYGDEGMIFNGNVPTQEQGVTWEVFRIENGRLTVTNRVCFDHPSNLPQTTAADEGSGRLAAQASLEEEKETGVQASENPAAAANAGAGGADAEERGEEAAEPEEADNEKIEGSGVSGEIPEEEESGNIEENADSATEDKEEKEEAEETAKPENQKDIGTAADEQEALKPEEETGIEEPAGSEEPGAFDEAEASEETEMLEETEPAEEIKASEGTEAFAEEAASSEESK